MKFTCSALINLPKKDVVEYWKDERHFTKWQDGFLKIEHLEGEPGTSGAKSKLYYRQGKRDMELFETIIENNLPDENSAQYEHTHMTNIMTTRFIPIEENLTRYEVEIEYTKFNGLMPKLLAKMFPGMFVKQSQKWVNQFKDFVASKV